MTAPVWPRTVTIDALTRSQRLMLKRAYTKTERRPLQVINGPKARMQTVAEKMIDLGLVRKVDGQYFAIVLTQAGHDLAAELSAQGWPNTEPPPHPTGEQQ
jgi:hypothetical protein